ncbi:primosomal protein N' [Cupriavidus pauculus]
MVTEAAPDAAGVASGPQTMGAHLPAARIARVAIDTPADDCFDYLAEGPDGAFAAPGELVVVPFGRRSAVGVVVAVADHSDVPEDRIRPIAARVDWLPPLAPAWIALARFAAGYYQRRLGEVMLPSLPPSLREPDTWARLGDRARTVRYRLLPGAADALRAAVPARAKTVVALAEALIANGPEAGSEGDGGDWMPLPVARTHCSAAPARLAEWVAAGWVEESRAIGPLLEVAPGRPPSPRPALHAEQEAAVAAIGHATGYAPFLLHGVTGSGKTEVYLHAMETVLAADSTAQVLMLVPEINLTPQLQARVAARFPALPLAVLHSGLADQERSLQWLAAHTGEARIVLGTRMAIMASAPNLRLIVVDEEHDTSYKQQEGLRYSARDLAVWRAKQLGIPVVLGSATPSMETWWRAEQGAYRKLVLRERAQADAALPTVRLIDLNMERQRQRPMYEGLSQPLIEAIEARLARGEQSLLFLNRRGYAPVLACDSCGWLSGCPRCSAYLVLHRPERRLRCHHCGLESPVPHHCPDCGNVDIAPLGRGTQRIEEALAARFPQARVARIDADSTRRKGSAQAMFDGVHAGEVDILVGTQMVAKGHDFQRVTLVGIVHPDAAMFSHDFRAAEHLFASLMQVSGRAGRAGLAGEVLIQTRYPDAPALQALARHDYDGFAASQLRERRQSCLPPFAYQVLLTAEHRELERSLAFLRAAREAAEGCAGAEEVQLHDPVPMSMVRVFNKERAQMLIEAGSRPLLQRFVAGWLPSLDTLGDAGRGVRWQLEIDPLRI